MVCDHFVACSDRKRNIRRQTSRQTANPSNIKATANERAMGYLDRFIADVSVYFLSILILLDRTGSDLSTLYS